MNLKKKPVFIIILLLGFTLNGVIVQAQCFPQPDECNQNDCDIDNVSLAIAADGANVFCDGESAIVAIDESQTINFDYFVYYWCDGVVDTLGFDEQPASHVYNIADEDLCEADEDSYFVRVVGVLDCGNGNITCRTAGVSLTIKYRPLALFSAPVQVCVDEPISFGNASCNTEEYLWDFGDNSPASTAEFPDHVYDSPGFYTVTLTVSNDCGSDTQTQTIEVVGEPEVDILQTDMLACAGSEIDFESTFNSYTNINWNITPNDTLLWCYTDTLIHAGSPTISVLFKQPDIFTVELTGSNVCGEVSEEIEVEIVEAPVIGLASPPSACESITITAEDLSFGIEGLYETISWEFINGNPPSASGENFGSVSFNQSGTINLTVESECGDINRSVEVIVNQAQSITMPQGDEYCQGSGLDTLIAFPTGGTWSGQGVSGNGVFNPSAVAPGNYTLTYSLNNAPCNDEGTITVTVLESETIEATGRILCIDSDPVQLTANPLGGSWSGEGVNSDGVFDPQLSDIGVFISTYTYVDGNGCELSDTAVVTVEALPMLSVPDSISLCLDEDDIDLNVVTGISAEPSGGIFTWEGEGVINPDGTFNSIDLGVGYYTIEVRYNRNDCEVVNTLVIEVTQDEPLVIDPVMPLCIDQGTQQLVANLSGGSWSGPGINSVSGLIDLEVAGGGTFTYTYAYAAGTSCEQTESIAIEIIDLSSEVSAGNVVELCEEPGQGSFTLEDGSPAGGSWSGEGITNAEDGIVDLNQLEPGQSYTYTYCIESEEVVGCSACDTKELFYHPKPAAGFSFEGSPCIGSTFTLIPDLSGLNYRWDFGDNTPISTLENPSHTYNESDIYTITQIVVTPEGCSDTMQVELYISSPPVAEFQLDSLEGCAPFVLSGTDSSFGDNLVTQWCIGEDTLAGPGIPEYVFDSLTQDEVFTILLKASNDCGVELDSAEILVHPYPLARFGISEDEGCSPYIPEINNITLGNADEYYWEFGIDNLTSTEFEPQLPPYTTTDDSVSVYIIRLIASNECGVDTFEQELTIYPPDVEAFIQLDTLQGCQPFTLYPQSFSTPGSILSWEVFSPSGQVTGGVGEQPELILPESGVYTIVLHASRCGTDSDTAYVEVLPAPEVGFTHPAVVCLGDSVSFSNQSVQVGNSIWDFGDGNTSSAFNPTHIFDSAGIFTVSYIGESLINNCPASYSSQITVLGLPQSIFSPSVAAGCPPFAVDFENESTGVGGLNYVWNFGDGSNQSSEVSLSHVFTTPGSYTTSLIAFDDAGCYSDTAYAMITVYPEPVSAFELSRETLCLDYDTLQLTNQAVDAIGYYWLIAGEVYTEPNPEVVPTEAGQFTVELIVENSFGCQDTSVQSYIVLASPRADFAAIPDEICAGEIIRFENLSTGSNEYLWDFGDGTGSSLKDPEHRFEVESTYEIRLISRSANGCPSDTVIQIITVHPNPVADFEVDQAEECGAPATVVFLNNSLYNLVNEWGFGDGTSSSALHPEHIYDDPGTYPVQLITTTDFGCKDTAVQVIDIFGDPVAEANLSSTRICAGSQVTLTANPTQALIYEWYTLPSLQPDTGRVFTTRLDQPGFYSFRLIAIYNERCRDTLLLTDVVQVFEQPVADFEYIADELENVIGDVRFLNNSRNATNYLWEFGDGATSIEFEPVHEYDINRDIIVALTAYNYNGGLFLCTDTIRKAIAPEWIISFEVPNAFSPGYGESAVREFGAVGSGVKEYTLQVYSPYGTLVWTTSELEEGHPTGRWDGFYGGEGVPQGAYSWQAEVIYVNGESEYRRGTVTVLR